MKLPFEKVEREVVVKEEAESSKDYGCKPEERKVEDLIDHGIIVLNKLQGPTSHQVSDYVKKILHIKKAGHSGTLDPNVTGVLPIALSKVTRIVQVLLNAGKEYVCVMHLHGEVSEDKVRKEMERFVGEIDQLPPIKSAVKRQWRKRNIYYLEVLEVDGKDVLFTMGCQAGTYVRKFCLTPDMEVLTKEGLISIKKIYDQKKHLSVFSFNKENLSKNLISDFQKIPYKGKILEMILDSGIILKVTPDHKLLVSKINGSKMIPARELEAGDYLYRSLNFPTISKNLYFADLVDDEFLIADLNLKEKCRSALMEKYGSIREFYRKTKMDRKPFVGSSKIDIKIKHLKIAGIFENNKSLINKFKTEKGRIINVNPKLTIELLYLIGLVASDGNNTKERNTIRYTRVKFHNNEKKLIDIFYNSTKKLFPGINIRKKLVSSELWEIDTSNSLFATICANLGVISPDYKSDILPIMRLNEKLIAAFLRGYFDGDGGTAFKLKTKQKGVYSEICYYSVNYKKSKRLHQMLLKLGIYSKIYRRKLEDLNIPTKSEYMYIVSVIDPVSKLKFIEKVGSKHPKKKLDLTKMNDYFVGLNKNRGDYLYCPLHFLSVLKRDKKELNQILGGNLSRIIKNNLPFTNYILRKVDNKLRSDFFIEKIKSIELKDYDGYVYDITVDKDHNFLLENGVVSSNCHDFGQKVGVGAHMQELIRTKAGPFNYEQMVSLHDLKDAYDEWQDGNEEWIRKCVLPFEVAVSHLGKIWVHDSAVDSLAHGAQLSLPGVVKFETKIKRGEIVAVMTLKGELVCIGKARMNTDDMKREEKGVCVADTKVFIERGLYPKYEKDL